MLKVNNKSSIKAGRGMISMVRIRRTSNGNPKPESSNFDRSCRMFDSIALAINFYPKKTVCYNKPSEISCLMLSDEAINVPVVGVICGGLR